MYIQHYSTSTGSTGWWWHKRPLSKSRCFCLSSSVISILQAVFGRMLILRAVTPHWGFTILGAARAQTHSSVVALGLVRSCETSDSSQMRGLQTKMWIWHDLIIEIRRPISMSGDPSKVDDLWLKTADLTHVPVKVCQPICADVLLDHIARWHHDWYYIILSSHMSTSAGYATL